MTPDSNRERGLECRVVAVVERKTGPPEKDDVSWDVVLTNLTSDANYDPDDVWDALEAAVKNGRLAHDEDELTFWIPE